MSCLLFLAPPAVLIGSDIPAILLLCAALTLGLVFYTFYFPEVAAAPEKDRPGFLRERKETVYENLRDLNFEYRAGKYPEGDYLQLRTTLEEEAAAILAELEDLETRGPEAGTIARSAAAPEGLTALLQGGKGSRAGKNEKGAGR